MAWFAPCCVVCVVEFHDGSLFCWSHALCGVSFVSVVRSMPMCMTIRAHVLIIEVYISVWWEQFQFIMEPAFDFVWTTFIVQVGNGCDFVFSVGCSS